MAMLAVLLPLAVSLLTSLPLLPMVVGDSSPASPPSPDPRLLFKFITITPEQCNSDSGGLGICYSQADCSNLGGTSNGNCAKGLGVCCTFTRTCGQQTKYRDTTFTNPSYPSAETAGTDNCELTIVPMTDDICQVRLDLVEFTLAQPDVDGQCVDDFMAVTGGTSTVPIICGDNAGQHMYVNLEPNSTGNIKINIDSSTTGAQWNIQVTQIPCTSSDRAPNGCLQYFTGTSGVVSSFNYAQSSTTPIAPRQLAMQNYGVCIQSRSGYCSVTWEQPTTEGEYFFSMTGDPGAIQPGTGGQSLVGDACSTDFVVIPHGQYADDTGTTLSADRYCGTGFPPQGVKSCVSPFVLYVVTDDAELDLAIGGVSDLANQGFSLRYRANVCSISC